jgi:pilus assembly protein CpaE
MAADRAWSVLLVDTEAGFVDDTKGLLSDHAVHTARNMSDAQRRLVEESIDVAVVGPGYGRTDAVREITSLFELKPTLPVIVVSDEMTTELLRTAMRLGVKDVLETPITAEKLRDSLGLLDRQGDEESEAVDWRPRIGKVITIMSPKGGAGKTVTATNVAVSLADWAGPDQVVVMDADLQFGDICIALQVDPKHTLVDVSRDIEKLDEELLGSLLARHPSGLRVLAAPLEPALADEVSTPVVVRTMGMLRRMFEYIVVDTAPFLDEPVLSILERSDAVLLVVDMDLPSVKNAKLALDTLRLIKFPFDKIRLVLNRNNSKARLDVAELERSLGLKVEASVVSDKLVPRSVNEGVPVVQLNPRSRVARDFRNVAKLVYDGSPAASGGERTSRRLRR